MRLVRLVPAALFVAAVPFFLIATNVRLVINLPYLYSYGFDKYDIPYWTGIERSELLSAGKQLRDYFNDDSELLDLRVVLGGVRRSLYNDREVGHMKDVKGLVTGVYRVQELTLAYFIVFGAVSLWIARRRSLPRLGRLAGYGGLLTLSLAFVTGLASVVAFQQIFLAFHLVSFSNDLWQLDPSRDYLIAMFPQSFFFDATMWIALLTVLEAVVLAAVPGYLLWWRPRRAATTTAVRQPREAVEPAS